MRAALQQQLFFLVPVLLVSDSALFGAQPAVQSVADSASFGPRVSPGSLASIFGSNLGTKDSASAIPLPTTLGGTSVEIDGASVPLLYVDSTQINFQVPSGLAAGQASLIVHAAGGDSASFSFTVLSQAPGIFQYGANHAVAQNGDSAHSLNSTTARAAAGSVITLYLTGQGALDNPVSDGQATPGSPLSAAKAKAKATIGVRNATVQFLGLTPGFVGLAQANIQVPNLPTGDYPLALNVGGTVSASVMLSVSGSGTPFTSPMTLVGTAMTPNVAPKSIALLGNTAYLCGKNRIAVVDVSNPGKPVVVGSFGDSILNGNGTICAVNASTGSPYLVDVVGPLANNVAFAVFSLSSPRSPQYVGASSAQYPYLVNLSFVSNFAFGSTSYFSYYLSNKTIFQQTGEFLAFDFTNPAAPQPLSVLTGLSDANLKPAAIVVNQAFAYIGSSTATGSSTGGTGVLDVINIGSPTSMYAANQVNTSPAAILLSLDVSGNLLLAAGNTTGNRNPGVPDFSFTGNLTITTMDITNNAGPALLASFDTGIPANGTFHTSAFSNGIFAIVNNPPSTDTGGPATLMIVDARRPASPLLYAVQSQYGFGGMISTSIGYLLAANSLGLYIYQLQWQ